MYVERELEKKILKFIGTPEIIALLGARQVGKTTLMRRIFDQIGGSKIFLDFEDPEIYGLFDEDVKTFGRLYVENNDFVFFDEFQNASLGGKNLKYLYDTYRKKFFVSGSSNLDLTFKLPGSLVGRIFVFDLFPFNLTEFFRYKAEKEYDIAREKLLNLEPVPSPIHEKLLRSFDEFAVFGGFPRVVVSRKKEEKVVVLKNLVTTYLLKDIRGFFRLSNEYSFNKLMKAVSLQISSLVNYSELSSLSELPLRSVKKYISILEETYMIRLSKPFYKNRRTEIVKNPKIFFLDNGIRNALINDFKDITERVDSGQLIENLVASELIKSGLELKFWRTKGGAEVDFVVEKNGRLVPIEVKSASRTNPGKSLISFTKKYGSKFAFIVYRGNVSSIEKNGARFIFVPVYLANTIMELV